MLKHLVERWSNWCGDRDMENSIRKHLTSEGYFGGTAKLRRVRLIAVQRPGWLQIYRFEATARVAFVPSDDGPDLPPEDREVFGLVREDGRKGTEVRIFGSVEERNSLFERWSDGLHCLRASTR